MATIHDIRTRKHRHFFQEPQPVLRAPRWTTTLLLLTVGLVLLLLPMLAAAQDIPASPAGNPNDAMLVGYCGLAAMLIGAVLRALSADNKTLPFTVSPQAMVMVATVGGIAEACLLAIVHGTPWLQAIGAAVLSATMAATHAGHVSSPAAMSLAGSKPGSGRPPPPDAA
jgi:hypothetical protein